MGVCCSKRGTVSVVTETKPAHKQGQGLLITENVGKIDSPRISVDNFALQETTQHRGNEAHNVKAGETPNMNNFRSTLIFPSYTGYKNPGSFGENLSPKRNHPLENTPTAFVTPVQNQSSSPQSQRAAVNFVAHRNSPLLSRYSPHPFPSLPRRTLPSPFPTRTSTRFSSSGRHDFDSDLETSDDEELPNQTQPLIILTDSEEQKKLQNKKPENVATQINLINKNEQEIQTMSFNDKTSSSSGIQTDTNKTSSNQHTDCPSPIEMVDASVGTVSDDFYRSTQTITTYINTNKTKYATTSIQTTPASKDNDKKRTPSTEESSNLNEKKVQTKSVSMATNTNSTTITVVDKCVGTNNDEIFEQKREIQTLIKKKKKSATTSTSTQNSPLPSPKSIHVPLRIVKEKSDIKPKHVKRSRSPSPIPPTNNNSEIIPKSDPIIETLENAFYRFARYGEINSDGKEMNNKNWAKLCRDCFFIDNKTVLVGDVDVIFSRHKRKGYRLIDFEMFMNCLNEIADRKYEKKLPDIRTRREIIYQGVIGKAPELIGITGVSATGNVGRMTDHTLYPVSHKIRFDGEGKGLGIEEKFEYDDTYMGYVHGYKERDTYDSKMQGTPNSKLIPKRPLSSLSANRPHSNSSQRS